MSAQGEQGVIELLELLKDELRLAMALSGNKNTGNVLCRKVTYKLFLETR